METLFAVLLVFQFFAIGLHDWIDVPGWTSAANVQSVVGRRKLAYATAINLVFPGVAVFLALSFLHRPKPAYALDYWLLYTGVTVTAAIVMWWIPYFFGSSAMRQGTYARMYAGTRHFLPLRGNDPGPNVLHALFHALFLTTLLLSLALRLAN